MSHKLYLILIFVKHQLEWGSISKVWIKLKVNMNVKRTFALCFYDNTFCYCLLINASNIDHSKTMLVDNIENGLLPTSNVISF